MADGKDKVPGRQSLGHEEDLAKVLERIKSLQAQSAKYRSMKLTVSGVGLILILGAVLLFVLNIVNFVRSYDTKSLAAELEKGASVLVDSKEARDMVAEIQKTCIPNLKTAFSKRIMADEQKFKETALAIADDVGRHIEGSVKEKLMTALIDSLRSIESDILKDNEHLTEAQIQKVVNEGESHFIASFSEKFEKRMDDIGGDLEALNAGVQKLTEDPEYKAMDPKMIGEYENRLVEHFLELTIFHLNPQRGSEPAVPKSVAGGQK